MIVDLENKEEKGTFELKGGGKIHLRLLSAEDFRAMRKACVKTVSEYPYLDIDPADPKKGKKYFQFDREEFDGDLFREMQLDRNITGWDDIFDRNKKPIPVTKENKVLLYTVVPEFREAVDKGLAALKEAEKARAEAAEKNS